MSAGQSLPRRRTAGWLYSIKAEGISPNSLMLDHVDSVPPYVDQQKMSVRARISNAAIDRVGDVLVPRGCQVENYRLNPVVLWNHGLDPSLTKPLGMSEDEDGNLSIEITDDDVFATCFFSQKDADAAQFFSLIAEKIIRATSVRETPVEGFSKDVWRNGQRVKQVGRWDLEEWSFCSVGVNPEAIAKCLSRNRLDGRRISEPIYKSLSAVAPKPQKPGIGFDLKETPMVEKLRMPNDMDDDGEEKDVTKMNGPTDDNDKKDPGEVPADQARGTDVEDDSDDDEDTTQIAPEPEPGGDPSKQPYGSQVIKCLHGALKSACKATNECLGPQLEHQGVKDDVGAVNDVMKGQMKALEGSHLKHYPAMKCDLKSDDMDGDDDEESGEDSTGDSDMKAFLAGATGRQHQIFGVAHRLKELSKSKSLTVAERRMLKSDIEHLDWLMDQAKSQAKAIAKAARKKPSTNEAQRLKALEDRLNKALS
jgi:hypothetical protein